MSLWEFYVMFWTALAIVLIVFGLLLAAGCALQWSARRFDQKWKERHETDTTDHLR